MRSAIDLISSWCTHGPYGDSGEERRALAPWEDASAAGAVTVSVRPHRRGVRDADESAIGVEAGHDFRPGPVRERSMAAVEQARPQPAPDPERDERGDRWLNVGLRVVDDRMPGKARRRLYRRRGQTVDKGANPLLGLSA